MNRKIKAGKWALEATAKENKNGHNRLALNNVLELNRGRASNGTPSLDSGGDSAAHLLVQLLLRQLFYLLA